MKLYRIQVDLTGGGDFIVIANSYEEAVDMIRPQYNIELEDDYLQVDDREIDEAGIILILS